MLRMKTSTMAEQLVKSDPREAVLVCVTRQHACRHLIYQGAQIAKRNNYRLLVLSVQPRQSLTLMGDDALEALFMTATEFGAEMSVYYSANELETADAFIRRNKIACVVTGRPSGEGGFIEHLRTQHSGLLVVSSECDDDSSFRVQRSANFSVAHKKHA